MITEPETLVVFSLAALAILAVPGPAVVYIVTRSIDQGRGAGVASVLGIHVGTLVHLAAATAGLSAILVSSATAFLQVARDAHGPALVAEVALELAQDRRDGEGGERDGAARVEPIDRLDQPERGNLHEVLERLPGTGVAAGELPREREALVRKSAAQVALLDEP